MLNLNEIMEVSGRALSDYEFKGWTEEMDFLGRVRTWLPALVAELREARLCWLHVDMLEAELTQAREELAAVDASLGDFYAPVLDPETDELCGSFWKDHGVWVMREELERERAETERLSQYVPMQHLEANAMAKPPDTIYLQVRDEDEELPDEVTWCVDRIHDTDMEYVPASKLRHVRAERDTLAALVPLYRTVDDYLHKPGTNDYPDGHCNPDRLAMLRSMFLEMSADEAGTDD